MRIGSYARLLKCYSNCKDLQCNPVYMYKMGDGLLLDTQHFDHNFLHKDFDICFECKLCLTDNQNLKRIPVDIPHKDFQSIQADIDKIQRRFAPCKLRWKNMDLVCMVWIVHRQAIVERYTE